MGWDGEKDDKGRKLLQNVGAVARTYNQDCWVIKAQQKIEKVYDSYVNPMYVFDDWRFTNEYWYFKNQDRFNVFAVKVSSPHRECLRGKPGYFDVSETDLDDFILFDDIAFNYGTLEDLKYSLEAFSYLNFLRRVK
jgi:hypothetical protein